MVSARGAEVGTAGVQEVGDSSEAGLGAWDASVAADMGTN